MTLPSKNSRRVVTNTGSVTTIDVDFPADQPQYVKVYAGLPGVYEMALGVDYTLDGVAAGNTDFTVNIIDPGGWEDYDLFAVSVDYVVEQPSDVDVGGPFGLRFENALDRLALIMQSLEDRVNRSVKMPVTGPVGPGNELVPNPDELIGWNADGTALETKPQISQSVQAAIDAAAEAAASALEAAGIVDAFELDVAGYTVTFNNNATAKTDDFNDNAVDKTAAFDANAAAALAAVDSLVDEADQAATDAEAARDIAVDIAERLEAPIGTYLFSGLDDAFVPPGYLLVNGASVTSTYPELRTKLIASGYPLDGNGDPILQDSGGYAFRGWLPGQLVDSGRVFGTVQADQIQNITGKLRFGTNTGISSASSVTGAFKLSASTEAFSTQNVASAGSPHLEFDASLVARTGSETRMANFTGTVWIKAYSADQVVGALELAELVNDVTALQVELTELKTDFLHVRDQKAAGTDGGASVVGNQVRTLNTVVANGIAGASLSSNQVTLPAGAYEVEASAPSVRSGSHQASLRTAAGTYLVDGTHPTSDSSNGTEVRSEVRGRFVLAASTAVELVQYCQVARATNGLGGANTSGRPCVFTEVLIWKVD